MRSYKKGLALCFVLLSAMCVGEFGYSEQSKDRFARLSKLEGHAYLLRYGLKEWEDAAVNMVLSEGDRIYTDEDSYLELQFDNGTVVKLSEKTDIEIIDLGREPETGEELTSIYVSSGDVNVNVPRYYKRGRAFNLETPQGLVSIEEESSARVDVDKETDVIMYKGRANVVGEKGEASLLGGERTSVEKGEKPEHPKEFKRIEGDRFDEWCREEEVEERVSRKYLPDECIVGVDELDCYGRWVYVHHYGWCWRPRVYFGWRPYYHGHWVYMGYWGWTWVSYEPWGWIPYHYGRWAYCWPYGWVWIPGRVWGPCWVVWCEYPGYIGWCPMGPCGGPWFSCSFHFGFGHKWVFVTKDCFKKYKYKHEPGKPYRRYKPYKYGEEPGKEMAWNKVAPNIKPEYAFASFDKKTAMDVPIPVKHRETEFDRAVDKTPTNRIPSKERRIPPPGGKEMKPVPDENETNPVPHGNGIKPTVPERDDDSPKPSGHKQMKPGEKHIPKDKEIKPYEHRSEPKPRKRASEFSILPDRNEQREEKDAGYVKPYAKERNVHKEMDFGKSRKFDIGKWIGEVFHKSRSTEKQGYGGEPAPPADPRRPRR